MKKTVLVLLALLTASILIFSACGKDTADNKNTTTITTIQSTTAQSGTAPIVDESENMTNDMSGNVESTNKDSALGDAVEGAADGVADANEDIADGVRNAENNNR